MRRQGEKKKGLRRALRIHLRMEGPPMEGLKTQAIHAMLARRAIVAEVTRRKNTASNLWRNTLTAFGLVNARKRSPARSGIVLEDDLGSIIIITVSCSIRTGFILLSSSYLILNLTRFDGLPFVEI